MPGRGLRIGYSGGGGGGSVTPSLVVEYVDGSGVRQTTTVVDGVTSISGVAPFLVKFDATGTRSTDSSGNTEAGAYLNIGYRMNFGEGLGTTWAFPAGFNYSQDEDLGPPTFFRSFNNAGTFTVRLKVKDALNSEQTISLTVVVAASSTLTTVNIPVANGAWPSFVSNRRYTLDAGGNYTSFGQANFTGLNNVLVEKTGSGADPIVGTVCFDNRTYVSGAITRASAIRFRNIDVAQHNMRPVGFDYCGFIGGRLRQIGTAPYGFDWDQRNIANDEAGCNSICYARGYVLWNTGETNSNGSYVLIDAANGMGLYGVVFNHSSAGFEHNIRGIWRDAVIRYSHLYNTASHKTIVKLQGFECTLSGETVPDAWRDDCRVGDYAGDRKYGYPCSRMTFDRVQFGASGEDIPETVYGAAPQNNDAPGTPKEALELFGVENCVTFAADPEEFSDVVDLGGRNGFCRNFRKSMGAGAYMTSSTSKNSNKIPSGWDGPYVYETTNTRPVPSAF